MVVPSEVSNYIHLTEKASSVSTHSSALISLRIGALFRRTCQLDIGRKIVAALVRSPIRLQTDRRAPSCHRQMICANSSEPASGKAPSAFWLNPVESLDCSTLWPRY